MPYEFIKVDKKGHLVIVTINRPEVMNALHPPVSREMDEVFNQFSENPEEWIAIITGAGDRAFSAGNDLKWQAEHGWEAVLKGVNALKGGSGGITRRFDCYKPIIAAVNGLALGGGFELALACDIIVAAENASFGLPEPRVGLTAVNGIHRVCRHIPYHLAMGILMTGRRISAQEAYRFGLINEVVPLEKLMPTAEKWASEILECAPLAVRATKEAAIRALSVPIEEAIYEVFPGTANLRVSEDFLEGPRAFAEKRKPQWKGR